MSLAKTTKQGAEHAALHDAVVHLVNHVAADIIPPADDPARAAPKPTRVEFAISGMPWCATPSATPMPPLMPQLHMPQDAPHQARARPLQLQVRCAYNLECIRQQLGAVL